MSFSLLIKPAGPDCNLNCKYCFYACKHKLFGDKAHRMSEEIAERLISDFLSQGFINNSFAWQGGEPALMGLDFYKRVVEFQKKYSKNGIVISNSFQTNATLLNASWCKFFNEFNFLLGISLDGPKKFHDYYRNDYSGGPTFDKVMNAIELCRQNKVEFNIIVLLNNQNVKYPDELFDFFMENKFQYLQFIPCVEKDPITGKIADYSINGTEYGNFMCRIFERWREFGVTKLSIRLFDSILNYFVYGSHTNCTFQRKCDDYIVIEHNGNAYCCDFFVDEDTRLGNIVQTPIYELFNNPIKQDFANRKKQLCNKCFVCHYSELCMGGCLKDRIVLDRNFANQNYLCDGYKMIFEKIAPQLASIAADFLHK
ncbi:MAG: anaerobic sulfatase maturase [Planctomycetes bacterium GWF2_41_51]|nr:MAG: anaerobic sulfatase maturase [Planctomycetes bacterium GWF2_41_51]HBG26007.1 anaerobic sulfatase maturase [Phycisphaerales bacterium]